MKLLQTYHSETLNLRNRVVMAPMTRTRADNEGRVPTDLMAEYYAQRASAGLIISEGTHVSPMAIGSWNVPGIYTDAQVEGWKRVTEAVHRKGGKIFAQLWHEGRVSHPDLLGGKLPLAPSAINPHHHAYTKEGFKETVTPKAMTEEEIWETEQDFHHAAVNAIQAGFDGVEIHAANGYLFHQFFMTSSNIRTDLYGGNIENRSLILFETLEAIRQDVPLEKVGVRLAPLYNHMSGIEQDCESRNQFTYIVDRLNFYGLAYLHLSGVTGDKFEDPLKEVLNTARYYRELYNGTLIINGGFTRDSAEYAIEEGVTDLVAFGQLFIGNPDLVGRFERDDILNKSDRSTYYGTGPHGYIDYPFFV